MSLAGRGLPDGPIVTGGLGFNEPATPGAMSALLVGTGTVTATLSTLTGEPSAAARFGTGYVIPLNKWGVRRFADTSARITGTGTLTATATTTERQPDDWADQLAVLLTLELV